LAMLFNNDPEKISRVYQLQQRYGSAALRDIGIVNPEINDGLLSTTITAEERHRAMHDTFNGSGARHVMIDPHTANGVAAVTKLDLHDPSVPILAMETAKPFKFNETMKEILGVTPQRPERFRGLEQRMAGKALTQILNGQELLLYLGSKTQAKPKSIA
jgi:threonine synthase